jgi:hypothetical protein
MNLPLNPLRIPVSKIANYSGSLNTLSLSNDATAIVTSKLAGIADYEEKNILQYEK